MEFQHIIRQGGRQAHNQPKEKMSADITDSVDGLPVMEIREWAREKHAYLAKYIDACRHVRKQFTNATCEFVDLYCGPGKGMVKGGVETYDGGALSSWQIAADKNIPFSLINISDQ